MKHLEILNPSKRHIQSKVLGRSFRNMSRYKKEIRVLCLPGISGWDIELIRGFSGPKKTFVGLEDDSKTFNTINQNYSNAEDVRILNIKTSDFLATTDEKFDLIYLDYFSNLSNTVRFDVETIFSRSILNPRGHLIVNIYGARENVTDFHVNTSLYKRIYSARKWPVEESDDMELLRCRAFGALIIDCIYNYKINVKCPKWLKYRSGTAFFYTAWLSYSGPTSKAGAAVTKTPKVWCLPNTFKVQEITTKGMSGLALSLSKRGMKNVSRNHYKALALKFYDENHRSPSSIEVTGKKGRINDWNTLLREVGLCPITKATDEDLLKELKRIEARDGFVSFQGLKKARISRRLGWSREYQRFCHKYGLKYFHDLQRKHYHIRRLKHLELVQKYIEYIESGKPKSYFPNKTTIRRIGIFSYSDALKKIKELKCQE